MGGTVTDRLRALALETLGIVATDVSNARLYFKHHPTRVPLAADPGCTTYRAYGQPKALNPRRRCKPWRQRS